MSNTLTNVCQDLKNYFVKSIHTGTFEISGGQLQVDFLLPDQYFRIVGSTLNEGVWQYPSEELKDETFEGAVWAMAVPPAVVALAADIDVWLATNAEVINSPFQSESFDTYSYNKGGSGGAGELSWMDHFRSRLNQWRRIHL